MNRSTGLGAVVSVVRNLPSNPVLRRELDVRAQSRISAIAMSAWLLVLAAIAALVYFGYVSTNNTNNVFLNDNARIGRQIFEWTLFGMMGLVLFLVPAFTSSSIAGERTRQTLIPVQMTALGPFEIVLGKALAAIAFTVLMILAAAPMLAVAFFVGGVTIGDLGSAIGILLLTAIMLGAVGIFFSSVFKSVQAATIMTYGFIAVIVIGSFITLGVVAVVQNINSDNFDVPAPPPTILAVNPFAGLADSVGNGNQDFFDGAANPLGALRTGIYEMELDRSNTNRFDPRFDLDADRGDEAPSATAIWRWYVVFAALVTYVSLYLASNRLRTPAVTER